MTTTTAPIKRALPSKRSAIASGQAELVSMPQLIAILRQALPAELKAHGGKLPTREVDAVADALAHQVADWVASASAQMLREASTAPNEEWITTQEAANRWGFSRPFVATLLDSGTYQGRITRTPGGHRKVVASEFEALMVQAAAQTPQTLAEARHAVELTRLDEGKAVTGTVRKQSRERARAVAKRLGLTA